MFLLQTRLLYVTSVEDPTEPNDRCGGTVNMNVKRNHPLNANIPSVYIKQNRKAVLSNT